MGRVAVQVSICSRVSLKPYVTLGHILMIKVKGMTTLLKRKKSRVYHCMEYWHDAYNAQF